MEKQFHKLAEIDERERRAICSICGPTRIKLRGKDLPIHSRFRCFAVYKRKVYPYIIHKKEVCALCGFIPKHPCQLDVDHKDGNHKNNKPENLQTLCANCHRLKTFYNEDFNKQNKK